jgi:hypothetical protein
VTLVKKIKRKSKKRSPWLRQVLRKLEYIKTLLKKEMKVRCFKRGKEVILIAVNSLSWISVLFIPRAY